MVESLYTEKLDKEWVELILQAKEMGLTIAEIQAFLRSEMTEKGKELHTFTEQQAKSEK
jgi:DNA-binding transcriptional MerR regulator